MKIYLVDNNKMFMHHLKYFLEDYLHYEICGEYYNGKNYLDNLDKIDNDSVILMDINMPIINGLMATKQGLWQTSSLKIIAVSQDLTVDLYTLVSHGFKGFVSKQRIFKDLNEAIKNVYNGKLYFPEDLILNKN